MENLTPYPKQSVNKNHKGNSEPHFNRMRMKSKLRTGLFTAKDIANEFGYNVDYIQKVARDMGVKAKRDPAGYESFFETVGVGRVALFPGVGTTELLKKAANYRGIRIRTWSEGDEIWVARY